MTGSKRTLQDSHLLIQVKSQGSNYGFIEYDDPGAAERAMATLNGRRVHQSVSYPKALNNHGS